LPFWQEGVRPCNGIRRLCASPAPARAALGARLLPPASPNAIRPRRSRRQHRRKETQNVRQTEFDIHQEITNRIVAALEAAGEFKLPWIKDKRGSFARPVNIASRNPYNGVNILSLWIAAMASDYPSNLWGTYRQWQERGCQVRRGEKSSLVVFYKKLEFEQPNENTGEAEAVERLMARASHVFNASQVDGLTTEDPQQPLPDAPNVRSDRTRGSLRESHRRDHRGKRR